jgi:hypothetical protein
MRTRTQYVPILIFVETAAALKEIVLVFPSCPWWRGDSNVQIRGDSFPLLRQWDSLSIQPPHLCVCISFNFWNIWQILKKENRLGRNVTKRYRCLMFFFKFLKVSNSKTVYETNCNMWLVAGSLSLSFTFLILHWGRKVGWGFSRVGCWGCLRVRR